MHVKEFGQLLIEISSLLEKISRGLYYERMKLSYLCTAEYYLFFPIFVLFSCFPDFSSKISLQPFKIETSNLVYRFTTTSCDMGLKMDILLFVLPCIFLSLYIFRKRSQPYSLGALKRGYSQIF